MYWLLLFALLCASDGQPLILSTDKNVYCQLVFGAKDGPVVPFNLTYSEGTSSVSYNSIVGTTLSSTNPVDVRLWNSEQTEIAHVSLLITGDEIGHLYLKDSDFKWCMYINYFGSTRFVPGSACSQFATYGASGSVCDEECFTETAFGERIRVLEHSEGTTRVFEVDRATDTISESAIVFALILFLCVWLTWMKGSTDFIAHQLSVDNIEYPFPIIWERIARHSNVIADVVILTLSTMLLAVSSKHPTIHSEELFRLYGEHSVIITQLYGYGMMSTFSLIGLLGVLYGIHAQGEANKQQNGQSTDLTARWFDFGFSINNGVYVLLVLLVVLVATIVEIMRNLFNDRPEGIVLGVLVSVCLLVVVSSKRKIISLTEPYANRIRAHHDGAMLLLTRLLIEFLVLVTIHGNLPVVFDGIISSTYKNGIGFVIALAICFVTGRDCTWISLHWPVTAFLVSVATISYCVLLMLAPSLIATTSLFHHPSEAVILAIAICLQLAAGGSVWTLSTSNNFAKKEGINTT